MRVIMWAVIVAGASAVMAAEGDQEAAKKALAGVWKGGVEQGAQGHVLTFTPEKITGKREEDDLGEGEFKLDLSKQPAQLDATKTKGRQTGKKYVGIYQLEGETLKWCVSTVETERPTEFATKGKQFLLVLKRQK